MALNIGKLRTIFKASNTAEAPESFHTYNFGSLGRSLHTARASDLFTWFHFEETERKQQSPGEFLRFRPSGAKFHSLCHLDVLVGRAEELAQLELRVRRSFLAGADSLFAQDLVKSFLGGALPQACQHTLHDFMHEITSLGGSGVTEGFRVFRGQQSSWKTETGWSRLHLWNSGEGQTADLGVHISPNPSAPNASRLMTKADNS